MALRLICSSCNGRGYQKRWFFFKRTCEVCSGTGRFIEKKFNVIEPRKKLNKRYY